MYVESDFDYYYIVEDFSLEQKDLFDDFYLGIFFEELNLQVTEGKKEENESLCVEVIESSSPKSSEESFDAIEYDLWNDQETQSITKENFDKVKSPILSEFSSHFEMGSKSYENDRVATFPSNFTELLPLEKVASNDEVE